MYLKDSPSSWHSRSLLCSVEYLVSAASCGFRCGHAHSSIGELRNITHYSVMNHKFHDTRQRLLSESTVEQRVERYLNRHRIGVVLNHGELNRKHRNGLSAKDRLMTSHVGVTNNRANTYLKTNCVSSPTKELTGKPPTRGPASLLSFSPHRYGPAPCVRCGRAVHAATRTA